MIVNADTMRFPVTGDILLDFAAVVVVIVVGAFFAVRMDRWWGWLIILFGGWWAYRVLGRIFGF